VFAREVDGVEFRAVFERLLPEICRAVQQVYGERLVTLAVFGSVGRGTPRPDSDIDLLVIADHLPPGRLRRVAEFEAVEAALAPNLAAAAARGVRTAAVSSPVSWTGSGNGSPGSAPGESGGETPGTGY
jgi:predicted nucleotidyltransferase